MERGFRKNRGITLMVLILMVVIMLILLGVGTKVIIDGKLINIAEKSVNGTNNKIAQEQMEVDYYIGELNRIEEQRKKAVPGVQAEKNLPYYIDKKVATIPKGFTVSGISTEQSIENGLVIYDIPAEDLEDSTKVDWENPDTVKTKYNQFVWIPVEVTEEDDETSVVAFARSKWTSSDDGGQRTTGLDTGYTEPYSYDTTNNYDGEDGTGIASQIAELTKSIYNYGGFWIGRYEAGVKPEADGTETPRTSSSSQTAEFVIQQDKYPYNWIKWGTGMGSVPTQGAVYLCNNLYTNKTNYGVKSMLCTGAAWDSMLDFIKDANHSVIDSTIWGNYQDSETYQIKRGSLYSNSTWIAASSSGSDVTKGSAILLTTGATERNNWKNLYDIAGNCLELTTEAYNGTDRVLRGGDYDGGGSGYPASSRYTQICTSYRYCRSFRPLLYINVN